MHTTGTTATTSALRRGVGVVLLLAALLVCGAFAHAGHAAAHPDHHTPGHVQPATTETHDGADHRHGHAAHDVTGTDAATVPAAGPLLDGGVCANGCGTELAVAALCVVALLGLAVLRLQVPVEQTWLPRVRPLDTSPPPSGRHPESPDLHALGVLRT